MQGIVAKKEFSKNGAPKFKIGGVWYFVSRDVQDLPDVNSNIDFIYEEFGEDRGRGRPRTIKSWGLVPQQSSSRQGGQPATNAQPAATITDYNILQSVSNIVGRIGQAGMIKTPEELEKWITASWQGLKQAPNLKASVSREPGSDDEQYPFDDKVPF